MKKSSFLFSLLASLLLLISLFSCASKRPEGSTEAEILFKEASELKANSHFIQANEKLNNIRSQFPYSIYATEAEILQADILFIQENYVEAAQAYILFKEFHPKHNLMPEIVYKISESYFRQLPKTIDRDLSFGYDAIKYLRELTYNFPTHPKATEAADKIKLIESKLEEKEIYIADFYFRTEDFKAAKIRYEQILKTLKNNDEKLRILSRIDLCTNQITNN